MQVAALERRFRLIVPDLPGCGHSGPLRDACSIANFAIALWALLDHLEVKRPNIIGFSLGGAVALEMALQRPESVPRLALINSLASYHIDHWRKWLEARVPRMLITLLGMKRVAKMFAARLFPHPWQKSMRDRAAAVIGSVPAASYLAILKALERWTAFDRLPSLISRTLIIAAEHDFTTVAEKRLLARRIGAEIAVVQGSRHGTPFDAVESTNASLLALMMDRPLPSVVAWTCDEPKPIVPLAFAGSLAEEHAFGPLGPRGQSDTAASPI